MLKKFILSLLCLSGVYLSADDFIVRNYPDSPGWVFRPGEEVTAVHRTESPMKTAPEIEWRDYYGNVRKIKTRLLDAQRAVFELPTEQNGYFTLKTGKAFCRYAVIPKLPPHDTLANPFGINFHLDRITLYQGAREIAFAKYIGLDWGRSMLIDWSDLRSADYDREFARHAGLIRQARESGMHVLGQILYVPRFASGRPTEEYLVWSRTPSESMKEVTEYARYMAKAYPFISHWEIGNEQNVPIFWMGRKSSTGNRPQVIRDYVDFLAAAYKGFKEVSPDCKVVFGGVTSSCPREFFDHALAYKGSKFCDYMNVHYGRNIPEIREIMKANQLEDRPFWVTEIGGTAGGTVYDEMRQLRTDLLMTAEQFADGAVKVFKYNLRNDGRKAAETEHNYGLITYDFYPKPNYVAYATMIRLLQNVRNGHRINVTRCADQGYLKGFEFNDAKSGKTVNFIILEAKPKAKVTFRTPDKELLLTDAMGVEKVLKAQNGKVEFEMTKLPVFITGKITPNPGKVVYPQEKLLRTIKGKFSNPDFTKGLSHWYLGAEKPVSAITRQEENGNGFMRVEIKSPGGKNFHGVNTTLHNDIAALYKQLKPDEYIVVNAKIKLRYKNLDNRGVAFTVEYLKPGQNSRFAWNETSFSNGSSDWKTFAVRAKVHRQTGRLRLVTMFAPRTTGVIDIDDLELTLEVWSNPR
ncbi:MAG: hypothetical protein IJW17_05000 [Lentisphaeria bacterium]|nr:hypothetical protein [Lentisphaeria bacterium]